MAEKSSFSEYSVNYMQKWPRRAFIYAGFRGCLDKNFLQQALTILEAKMPYEFIHSGLLYYLKKGEDREKFLTICEEMYLKLARKDRYWMKDLNH